MTDRPARKRRVMHKERERSMPKPADCRTVIGIDPGECTGVAMFVDGVLVWCYASTPDGALEAPTPLPLSGFAILELPRVYKARRGYAGTRNPDSIVRLAVTLGRWEERLRVWGVAFREVRPRTWKGTVEKDAMGARILALLSPAERVVLDALGLPKSKIHNVIDAIGLGLFELGRLQRMKERTPWAASAATSKKSATERTNGPPTSAGRKRISHRTSRVCAA